MSTTSQLLGRRGVIAATAVVLGLGGVSAIVVGLSADDGPAQPPLTVAAAGRTVEAAPGPNSATAPSAPDPAPVTAPSAPDPAPVAAPDFGPVLEASPPTGLEIPAIDLRTTTLVPLEIGADGALGAPVDFATAGWHIAGPTPGQLGPAVIAGHVDGPDGPAIFYRLGELTAGAEVLVTREDGSVARFVIDSVERFAKADFPTALVYGNTTNRAELRLITCGGAFDPVTGHYVDNIVAFAHLVA